MKVHCWLVPPWVDHVTSCVPGVVVDAGSSTAFVEAALLVEAGYLKNLDGLVVTWCRPEQQLARLRARGLGDEDARRRIAAQLPVTEKLRYATEKIDCSGSLEDTRTQVAALAAKLRRPSKELSS